MTIEEAIYELKIQSQVLESMILYNKDFEPRNNNTSLENKKNAIDMAIEALEKQIPKKMENYYCPICRHYFEDGEEHIYCPSCGQAID